MPDRDVPLPRGANDPFRVSPVIVRSQLAPVGEGTLPGSTYKNREDTPSTRGPGMELRLPLP